MMKMMCPDETKRLSIDEVMQHEWIKSYFVKDENELDQNKLIDPMKK